MESGQEFVPSSIIRDANNNIVDYVELISKNDSSPGPLLPEASNTEIDIAVTIDELDNIETLTIIADRISNFLSVPLNASNYNDPPALIPMSGTFDPVNINTRLENAFSLEGTDIGRIVSFKNLNPGFDYVNDVFAIVYDPLVAGINRFNQIVSFSGNGGLFSIGDEIQQGGVTAKIMNISGNNLFVRPYSLLGIQPGLTFTHKGTLYNILNVTTDYSSNVSGNNAIVTTVTDFAIGKITGVKVINSGYGYVDQAVVTLIDGNNRLAVKARISARGQGETEGAWITYSSHIGVDFGKVLQDSYYYQDYSYEIQSKLGINSYEKVYKDIIHVSGTKLFGKFDFEDIIPPNTKISLTVED
jgi:hypothetical protein